MSTPKINTITLRNFQKHRKLDLNLDNVTTIVGSNDIGKSAILRALRWVCLNQPQGSDFKHWDAKAVSVTIEVDGTTIKRKRGSSNSYTMDDREFKAFGVNVPLPIADVLGVSEDNFQTQQDVAYLLSKGGSAAAKELNRIVDLEVIDTSLSNAAAAVRKTKTVHEVTEERFFKAVEERDSLKWVVECDTDLTHIEELTVRLDKITSKIRAAKDAIEFLKNHESKKKLLKQAISDGKEVVQIAERYEKRTEVVERVQHYIKTAQTLKESRCEVKQKLTELNQILLTVKTCPTCGRPMS